MASLSEKDFKCFDDYHHTLMILMTDRNPGSSLKFVGEYFSSGKRLEQNQPGITSEPLDMAHHGEQSIHHYFCNQRKAVAGLSGGMMYIYNGLYLYIGFSNPLVGCKKCFVELTPRKESARWAYEQLYDGEIKTSRCSGWKVEARYILSQKPIMNVTLGTEYQF